MSNSNYVDATGIVIETYQNTVSAIVNGTPSVNGLVQIYGTDINVQSNSPDGQMVNIYALSKQDILQLIVQDYDAKDPDQAVGVALDGVAQLCGIYRKGGTYTLVQVTVTTNQAVNLVGLDTPTLTPFTVADSLGNKFQLINSISLNSGATALNFQAATLGSIQVLPNTITVPITNQLGIVSVNNNSIPYQAGENQETDAQFRVRRQSSVAAPSKGYFQSLVGNLLALNGVVNALVVENNTGGTVDSVPAHSIWAIVDGGTDQDIANAIYKTRSAGCGMYGSNTVGIVQVDGTVFNTSFDRVVVLNAYISFHVDVLGAGSYDANSLKSFIAANYLFDIYEPIDVSTLITMIKGYNPTLVISNAQVSANGVAWFTNDVYPTSKINKFTIPVGNITIV